MPPTPFWRRVSSSICPRGRYPIVYSKNYISTLLPHIQHARSVAYVLQNDALFRARPTTSTAPLTPAALVNNARSIGDEPMLIAQLVRMAIRAIAVGQAERTLGQGEPSPEGLAALQRALEEEAEETLLLWALRGERGGIDQFMQTLQNGGTSVKQMQGLLAGPGREGPETRRGTAPLPAGDGRQQPGGDPAAHDPPD